MPYDDAIYSSIALQVADDDNYAVQGDSKDGTPTKVEPSLGFLKQSARPRRQLPAQIRNWIDNQIAKILDALHDDGERVEDWAISENKKRKLVRVQNWVAGSDEEAFRCGCWNPVAKAWFFAGDAILVRKSLDLGHTLVTGAESLTGTDDIYELQSNAAGTMIALGLNGDANVYDAGTGNWTNQALAFAGVTDGLISGDRPSLCYDETATKWFGVGLYDGFGVAPVALVRSYSSNDGATWTPSATFPSSGGSYNLPRCAAKPGRIVVTWWDGVSDGTLRSAYSTDGGVNFSTGGTVSLATGGPTFEYSDLVYDEALALFVGTITDSAGGCKIFTSPDAVTWTVVFASTTAKIRDVQCLEDAWCAYDMASKQVVYSPDAGANWYAANLNAGANGDYVRFHHGNGQFAFLFGGATQRVWVGSRTGDVAGTAIT